MGNAQELISQTKVDSFSPIFLTNPNGIPNPCRQTTKQLLTHPRLNDPTNKQLEIDRNNTILAIKNQIIKHNPSIKISSIFYQISDFGYTGFIVNGSKEGYGHEFCLNKNCYVEGFYEKSTLIGPPIKTYPNPSNIILVESEDPHSSNLFPNNTYESYKEKKFHELSILKEGRIQTLTPKGDQLAIQHQKNRGYYCIVSYGNKGVSNKGLGNLVKSVTGSESPLTHTKNIEDYIGFEYKSWKGDSKLQEGNSEIFDMQYIDENPHMNFPNIKFSFDGQYMGILTSGDFQKLYQIKNQTQIPEKNALLKTIERCVVWFQFTWDSEYIIFGETSGKIKLFCVKALLLVGELLTPSFGGEPFLRRSGSYITSKSTCRSDEQSNFLPIAASLLSMNRKIVLFKNSPQFLIYNTMTMKNGYVELLQIRYKKKLGSRIWSDDLNDCFELVCDYGYWVGERIMNLKMTKDNRSFFVLSAAGKLKLFSTVNNKCIVNFDEILLDCRVLRSRLPGLSQVIFFI